MNNDKLRKIYDLLANNILITLSIGFIVLFVAITTPIAMGHDIFHQSEHFEVTTAKVIDNDLGHYLVEFNGEQLIREQGRHPILKGQNISVVMKDGLVFEMLPNSDAAYEDVEFLTTIYSIIISFLLSVALSMINLLLIMCVLHKMEKYLDKRLEKANA